MPTYIASSPLRPPADRMSAAAAASSDTTLRMMKRPSAEWRETAKMRAGVKRSTTAPSGAARAMLRSMRRSSRDTRRVGRAATARKAGPGAAGLAARAAAGFGQLEVSPSGRVGEVVDDGAGGLRADHRVSSSRVARLTPVQAAEGVSSALRRREPIPGNLVEPDRRSRIARAADGR